MQMDLEFTNISNANVLLILKDCIKDASGNYIAGNYVILLVNRPNPWDKKTTRMEPSKHF